MPLALATVLVLTAALYGSAIYATVTLARILREMRGGNEEPHAEEHAHGC